MNRRLIMAVCVVAALVLSAWAAAGHNEGAPQNWALIVAVSSYRDPDVPHLDAVDNDAKMVYSLLTDRQQGTFSPDHVRLMTVSSADPVLRPLRMNILNQLLDFLGQASTGDTVLFYFSGHGAAGNGNGYLLAEDTYENQGSDFGLPLCVVNDIVAFNNATRKIVILDACHSGPTDKGFVESALKEAPGRATLTACAADEVARIMEVENRSVFTFYLLQGLSGEAEHRPGASVVTVHEAYDYAFERVRAWAAEHPMEPPLPQTQTPRLQENIAGAIPLVRLPLSAKEPQPATKAGSAEVLSDAFANTATEAEAASSDQTQVSPQAERLQENIAGAIPLVRLPPSAKEPQPVTKAGSAEVLSYALANTAAEDEATSSDQTQVSPQDQRLAWRPVQLARTFRGHAARVNSVAFSPDQRLLASASDDKSVKLWDLKSGECLRTLQGDGKAVESVVFSPDGRLLASGSEDGGIRLWEAATGALLRTLHGHRYSVTSVAFSRDGRLLASGSWDRTVRLWNAEKGICLHTLEHTTVVVSVAFSPDGRLLATASGDGIRLWDAKNGKPVRTFPDTPLNDMIVAIAFSPDGRLLASGSWDRTARLWDVPHARCVSTFSGHADSVTSVAFSPDGRLLASGSWDRSAQLWDVGTGRHLSALLAGQSVKSLTFSPTSEYIALGALNDAQLWQVPKASVW